MAKTKRQMAAEMKEIDRELKVYNMHNASLENNISTIERKKAKILGLLNANRSRHNSVLRDVKKSSRELKKVIKATRKAQVKYQSAKESVDEQKKELDSLKISMSEQIDSVTANIDSLRASSSLWELERVKSLQSCEEAKEAALKSFSRFVNISSPTQMWLSSEVHATRSMTAMADLQGLVGEWSALRAVAAEIQVIASDSTIRAEGSGKQSYSPDMIFLLKEKTERRAREMIHEGAALKADITALEKERRHMHTLLCDLIYFLEGDSKHYTSKINAVVAASMKASHPADLDLSDPVIDKVPPKSALKKPTRVNTAASGEEGSRQPSATGSRSGGSAGRSRSSPSNAPSVSFNPVSLSSPDEEAMPAVEVDPDSGHLTDLWLQRLDVSGSTPLISALRHHLAGGSDSEPATAVPELKTKRRIEDVRLGVAALETKIVWRSLQKVSQEICQEFCEKAKNEWDSFGSRSGHDTKAKENEASENHHYGRFNFDQSETLEPADNMDAPQMSLHEDSVALSSLRDCLGFYDRWRSFRQLLLHTSMATEAILPASPIYMLGRVVKIAKKPRSRLTKSMSMYDTGTSLVNAMKGHIGGKPAGKALVQSQEEVVVQTPVTHEHLQASDRMARKRERTLRIKVFQQKLVAKRITGESSFALMSEDMSRRLADKSHTNTSIAETSGEIIRPSDMVILEDSDEDDDEDEFGSFGSDSDEGGSVDGRSVDSRKQLLSEIADKGIKSGGHSSSSHSMPLIGENSFVENGLSVQFEPRDEEVKEADTARLYADLLERVDRELSDQIVTQLTLKMGPESVNVVAYWQPIEDRLKIKLFCFHRNEEYTCYVDHAIVKDLFHKSQHHTSSAKIQSLYVIRRIIERMTIEHIPRSQALEMSMQLTSSYPMSRVTETPDLREESMQERKTNKKKKKEKGLEKGGEHPPEAVMTSLLRENFNESMFVAKALNNEEEDKLRVLTIRSVETKAVLVCAIAKVKTSNWEDLLSALPRAHRDLVPEEKGSSAQKQDQRHEQGQDRSKAMAPSAPSSGRAADDQPFRKRPVRYNPA